MAISLRYPIIKIRALLLLSFVLLAVQLTACGFHLRGSVDLPIELTDMALLDGEPATDIAGDLHQALRERGVRVSDDVKQAKALLQVHGESFKKRVSAVGVDGKAKEYRLSYGVTFSLKGADGEWWLSQDSVTVQRDMPFDATAVLAMSQEEGQLRGEMRREAVTHILRRLQYARTPEKQAPEPAEKKENAQ